jgi:hypothetical protein
MSARCIYILFYFFSYDTNVERAEESKNERVREFDKKKKIRNKKMIFFDLNSN